MSDETMTSDRKSRSPIRAILRSVAQFLRDERQYRHLDDLPDHLLRDVGLDRSDIARARKTRRLCWLTPFK